MSINSQAAEDELDLTPIAVIVTGSGSSLAKVHAIEEWHQNQLRKVLNNSLEQLPYVLNGKDNTLTPEQAFGYNIGIDKCKTVINRAIEQIGK